MKSPDRNSFSCSLNGSIKWMKPVYSNNYGKLLHYTQNFSESLGVERLGPKL
jgi:hypothetical protein